MVKPDDLPDIAWKDGVKESDLDAAEKYLTLRLTPKRAQKLIRKLGDAGLEYWRVNDLLRACDRVPVSFEDRGVKWKLDKVVSGKRLTPPIAVSFDGVGGDICQGFHEVSLQYALDPFAEIPVFIAYEGD